MAEKRCVADRFDKGDIQPASGDEAKSGLNAAARFLRTVSLKCCSSPAREGAPMSGQSIAISPSTFPLTVTTSPAAARPAAARTKLLLEGPILPTLLRLAAPNILNLLAIAGMITFDGL